MADICNDNRFELIEKYRNKLIEATNIEDSPEEMKVLNDILFRFWQMGWLDKLEIDGLPTVQPFSWISVNSDIKPKEGQEVLTIYEGHYEGQYSKDRARCYYANGGIAFESLESMVWKYSISRIRAWMPIPTYEEGE